MQLATNRLRVYSRFHFIAVKWIGVELATCAFLLPLLFLLSFGTIVSASLVPRAPLGLVWESPVADGSLYYTEVERLVTAYEREVGQVIKPSKRAKVALKINTRGRMGLSTPLQLIRAVVEMLEARGYDRQLDLNCR